MARHRPCTRTHLYPLISFVRAFGTHHEHLEWNVSSRVRVLGLHKRPPRPQTVASANRIVCHEMPPVMLVVCLTRCSKASPRTTVHPHPMKFCRQISALSFSHVYMYVCMYVCMN